MKNNSGITCNIYILYIKIYVLIDIDIVNVQTTKTLALTIWEILTGEALLSNDGQAPN